MIREQVDTLLQPKMGVARGLSELRDPVALATPRQDMLPIPLRSVCQHARVLRLRLCFVSCVGCGVATLCWIFA